MGLDGCEQNAYTYGYIAKGLCEKGMVVKGFDFYKEMREKGLVPSSITYMIVICSLALERRFEDAIDAVFDTFGNSMYPALLTYKTLLEGMCRGGRSNDAFELLDEIRKRDPTMNEKNYKALLNGIVFSMSRLIEFKISTDTTSGAKQASNIIFCVDFSSTGTTFGAKQAFSSGWLYFCDILESLRKESSVVMSAVLTLYFVLTSVLARFYFYQILKHLVNVTSKEESFSSIG